MMVSWIELIENNVAFDKSKKILSQITPQLSFLHTINF